MCVWDGGGGGGGVGKEEENEKDVWGLEIRGTYSLNRNEEHKRNGASDERPRHASNNTKWYCSVSLFPFRTSHSTRRLFTSEEERRETTREGDGRAADEKPWRRHSPPGMRGGRRPRSEVIDDHCPIGHPQTQGPAPLQTRAGTER